LLNRYTNSIVNKASFNKPRFMAEVQQAIEGYSRSTLQ